MIIINATVGLILKSFMAVRPIFTIIHQIKYKFNNFELLSLRIYYSSRVLICQFDHVCTTLDTIGRNLILVNLAIPFFFYYKFDSRFNECFANLIKIIMKKIAKKMYQQKTVQSGTSVIIKNTFKLS